VRGERRADQGRAASLEAGRRGAHPADQVSPTPARQGTRRRRAFIDALEAAIVFEDARLLALNKPLRRRQPRWQRHFSFGAIETLRALRPGARTLELVHRLDRDTSGLLVVAKKRSCA
jgi:23S rRNA pseudouridine955/2504/2580 synthase